jgi:hypothetical protein
MGEARIRHHFWLHTKLLNLLIDAAVVAQEREAGGGNLKSLK